MAIDLKTEPVMPLDVARQHRLITARHADRRPVSFVTIWHWANRGLRGIRLDTVKVGRTLCTSEAAIIRFFEALSAAPGPGTKVTPAEAQRAHEAAMKRLKSDGIC